MARAKAVASPSKLAGTPGLVSVYTLGRFEVAIDGHPLRFKSKSRRKPLELLKVLVSLGGEGTSVVQLTESLWPDSEGDHAYGAFTVNLNRLRRLIGHDSLRLQDGRLHLNAERCWVDAQAFTQLLASASRAIEETRGDEAWRHLEEALRLYRGPFLEGEFDPPEILSARERLHGLFLRHIEQLGDFYQQSGQQPKAIVLYQKGLEIDDLGEELYQNLMRCYLQLDRLVEGVAVYERCRKIFRASVGIDPSPDTEAIYQQLVNAQHRPRPVAPSPEPAPAPEGPAVEPAEQAAEQVAERLEETSTPHPEGERRTATIACYGISGYASMNELLDPEEVEGIMGRIREAALRIVEHEEGIVNQFAGNEVLALFGFPRAHEDDPERAVRCAIKLHEFVRGMSTEVEKTIAGPLRMHSGINTGLIVIHPGDSRDGRYGITGDAVNTAERLLAEATADEILVSPETHRLIEPFFHTVSLDPSSAQGNLRPLTAHQVVRESRMRSRFEAAQQRGFTPFTGREQELAILRECVDKACAGEGQLVTVVGEAGLGKSRLIYELRHGMERGRMAELQGHCLPNGINTPYLPFLDVLRRGLRLRDEDMPARHVEKMVVRNVRQVDSQLERYIPLYLHLLSLDSEEFPLPPQLKSEDLRNAIEEALAAIIILNLRHKPMLLVLESWHWADEASVTTVHKLMGVIAHNPMLVVINYRPEYPARWGNMSHHTHISLKPLDSAQTGHIARSAFRCETLPDGLPEMIHKRTEGNPFFIEELCGALVEEQLVAVKGGQAVLARPLGKMTFPDTVQAVLRARLDRLSSTALDALRMAAVIGLQFGQEVLQRLSKTPQQLAACLETLKSLDLIFQVQVFPEVVYRFRHAITQMVAYESLLMQRRKDLHERVGQALEEDYADRLEEHYEALAHHYRNTSNTEKALHYLECAGHKAHQYFSLVEAREHYRAAIDLIQTQEPTVERKRRQVDLAVKLGTVSFYSPSQDLLTVLETSLEYARQLKDNGRIARATTWIGMI
ncbi:MAG: BTAD domain-containing putative transcriptional regulator, partial [SAR324 cluster bacterium]|nr:BTAD domain-containing putative transcriptional regulator [SAR324 cluster bacterium]